MAFSACNSCLAFVTSVFLGRRTLNLNPYPLHSRSNTQREAKKKEEDDKKAEDDPTPSSNISEGPGRGLGQFGVEALGPQTLELNPVNHINQKVTL